MPSGLRIFLNGREVAPEDAPMQQAARSKKPLQNFEHEIVFPDGTRKIIYGSIAPILDANGNVREVIGSYADFTDRKQAEDRLLESEQRLSAELDAVMRLHAVSARLLSADNLQTALDDVLENAIATSGADLGNIQLYNPEIAALEIVAQRGFRPDFLDYFRYVRVDEGSACAQAMAGGHRIVIEDVELDPTYEAHRAIAADAGYRAVQSTPIKRRDGSVLGMLSTHFRAPQGVSERNQRLLDLYARHAGDVIERSRMEQALRQADRRKDEFLAVLAHELRNPLAPLRSSLEVLRLAADDPGRVETTRRMMERQLGFMVRLVDDLLDVSRITQGMIRLQKENVALDALVQSGVDTSRPLIEAAGHHLIISLPAEPLRVNADPARLAQVIANLLNNSAKYTEPGGDIWLTADRDGGDVVISVRDTGIGIPSDQLPRVFDMFSQTASALDRAHGGLGIGLALVRGLVELHGGTVEARSMGPGTGSEFVVRLPLGAEVAGEPSRKASAANGQGISLSRCRVLIVDDNRDATESLDEMLQLMGHETRTAHDGIEAVQAAGTFRPHLVLMDIGLPRKNGYEAARGIREHPWAQEIVLVAVTGWGQEADKRRAAEAGFDHHVTKPIDPPFLEELIHQIATAH